MTVGPYDAGPYTVCAVPKDRHDDMTDGRGLPVRGMEGVSLEAAVAYAGRNESPDNPDHYVIRDQDGEEVTY